ncbi:MAG: 6-phosphofructokinase [Planctomycetota bacterium]|jgi:6-phosphofructokinase 1
MAELLKGNAVVGQAGGPTAVVNQSLAGLVEGLRGSRSIPRLFGARYGVRGIIERKFVNLKSLKPSLLERLAATPGAALGSTRDKPDEAYCRKILRVFEKLAVRYFFYIGGNDSADTAKIVNDMAEVAGYELCVFHIPKTIDNDLRVTDHCPGYGSAVRFVAAAFRGDDRDSASLPGIKINVVMGRHSGWLTAGSALGRSKETSGPHLIYLPEVPFSLGRFLSDVRDVYFRLGRCQIAVAEGIADKHGKRIAQLIAERLGKPLERDDFGNVQLSGSGTLGDFLAEYVRKRIGGKKKFRVRADTFGYLQRSFPGLASSVDEAEARECGRKAAEYVLAGFGDGSVAIRRLKGERYRVGYFRARLEDVAKEIKPMPRSFINKAGNGVTKKFIDYAMPLAGRLPPVAAIS